MNARIVAIIVVCFSIALPVLAADKDSAYFIEKRDFKKQYKTIALSPVDAGGVFKMPDSVAMTIEQEITKHLKKRGYKVIPSSVLGGIRQTMEAQVGGVKDPKSGATDMDKVNAVRSHAFRELWLRHEFDAIATIRVSTSTAQFAKGKAEWDGVKQKVASKGRDKGYGGNIVASSVSFAVYDESNRIKYLYYGGLELLQKRVNAQLQPIPAQDYFSDEKRIKKAAKIAVSSI